MLTKHTVNVNRISRKKLLFFYIFCLHNLLTFVVIISIIILLFYISVHKGVILCGMC